ncbi:phosphatidylglycerophosphatase A [Anaplasmataceae bacterium AB001_6]|nr:phosphatidylglycerophosphatase A [Anaplasmataceae bacterium AB001_6]
MLNILFVTFFFTGKFRYCPGTIGSLASFVLLPFFFVQPIVFYSMLFFIAILGTIGSDLYSKDTAKKDPKEVVIDEVLGQMITFVMIFHANNFFGIYNLFYTIFTSFILFRLFDITKPFPISIIDKKVKGGVGIMLDDVFAAVIAGILYFLFVFFYLKVNFKYIT